MTTPEVAGGGRYEIRRLLGEGARKRVYLAHDTRLGRDVALAVVKTDGLDDIGRARIDREARAMARLGDHPHVVTVFDIGDDDDEPFIVSQYMPGGSLADRLAAADAHRLPVDEALAVASDVALGLEHAHRHDIVHRDLKPANVWFDADGRARLGDFGLAVPVDQSRLTAEGMVVGTVAYLAPEQALGRSPDARSDLYALGALLYEAVTGRPPFEGDDAVGIVTQHLNTAPVTPSWHNAEVAPALDALILRLLAKDPDGRPESATETVALLTGLRNEIDGAAPPSEPALLLPAQSRFVGREDDLSRVRALVDESLSGHRRVVMIVGEPGIGKTRLAEEAAAYAHLRGAQVCWGRSYEGELGAAYFPFVEAFRAYVRERSDDELRAELSTGAPEVATLVSELRDRFPDLGDSPPLDGDAERLRLFEGITTFIRNAAAARPIVLVLDDLHWADKPSLLLLQYLARNLRRDRVLLVGTYRDVELDRTHPLADAISQLRRERLYDRVLLRGLPRDEVKALIEATGDQSTPDEFADLVYRETEGNPFFVAEILRHFVETGAIRREGDRWVGTPESIAENLPEGVREVIGRRLSKLSEGCNEMLTVAGTMPGGFSVEVVAAVTEQSEDAVLDHLDEALEAQVVRERQGAPGSYEFAHALIRQTLYGELSTPRRVRLHRRVLVALEARGTGETHLPELAYHSFQAAAGGDVDKAVGYATRAGERASGQAAHEEAARFYDMALQALDLTDDADPARRAELMLAFGEAGNLAGEPDAARAALLETAAVARTLADPVLLGRSAYALALLRWTSSGSDPTLVGLLEEAIAALEPGRDELLRAKLLTTLGSHIAFLDAERHQQLDDEAVAIAREVGDPGSLARILSSWSFTARAVSDPKETERRLDEAVTLAREAGDNQTELFLRVSRMIRAMVRSDRAGFERESGRVVQLAAETRSPPNLASSEMVQTTAAVLEGRYDDAERHAAAQLALARRTRDVIAVQNHGVSVFPMRREQGRLAEFEEATRRTAEAFPALGAWRVGLAYVLVENGDLDGAAAEVEAIAADDFANVARDVLRPYTLAGLAEVTAKLGDHDLAARIHPHLAESRTAAAVLGSAAYHGICARYLGLLDMLLERHDEAVVNLEAALERHERMLARPWSARTRYDLARALLARGGDGDQARAFGLLNEALDAATAIGMARLVEEAMAEKLRLQGVDESSAPGMSIDAVAAAVSVERPDLRRAAGGDGRLTIVFSDLEGYTALTDRLGDIRAQDVLRTHNELVRGAVTAHGGREVKSAGDGFMLVFTDPVAAVNFARAARDAVGAHDFGPDAGTLRLRVGLHAGRVIEEADDFYGRTVILASRVAATAAGGEILVTDAVRDQLDTAGIATDAGRDIELKGLAGPHRIYAVR